MDISPIEEDKKYKSFAKTFKLSSYCLAITMMYPNPSNRRRRIMFMFLIFLSVTPVGVAFMYDLYKSYTIGDVDNMIRILTLSIPFPATIFKIVIANYVQTDFEYVLNEISMDMHSANDLPEECQKLVDQSIKSGMVGTTIWSIASVMVTGSFFVVSSIRMMYHNLTHNEVKRFMILEVEIPYLGQDKYEAPYFQIICAYYLYLFAYYFVNFVAYDATFCISVNHASLKFALMTYRMNKIFDNLTGEREVVRSEMKKIVIEHNRILEYISRLQTVFGYWLASVFFTTLSMVVLTLYELTASESFDPAYMIYVIGSVNHVYTPCHFSAVLYQTGQDLPTKLYSCGWERVMDSWVTDTIRFMIARAQQPLELTAMGMVTFNMLLFVSIMKTSYSMYTLLESE